MLRLDGCGEYQKKLKSGFWRGLLFGLGYFIFGFYWIGSAFIARGPEFAPFMVPAVFLFCLGLALFWGFAGLLYVRLIKNAHSPLRAAIFASVFFLIEYIRGHIFGGLPWNLPGYIFKAGAPVSQFASVVGVYGLSALAVFLAGAFALAIQAENRVLKPLIAGLIAVAGIYAFGFMRLSDTTEEYVDNAKLRIVHANIPQKDKFDPTKYVENVSQYLQLTGSAGFEDVTHVIWPEGAVPGLMLEDKELMRVLNDMFLSVADKPPYLIVQTLRAEARPGKDKPAYYNAAVVISFQKGQEPQTSSFYDKQKLVPFGEFIPGGELVEKIGLKSLSSALESMSPGTTGHTPTIPGLPPVSLQICYEIIFPGFTPNKIKPSDLAPEWILNLSNDAWYGDSTGPQQHINQAAFRAIEEGIPVIRSTSGGISGVINSKGQLIESRNISDNMVLDARLPRDTQQNAYDRRLNLITALIILILLIGCCWGMQLGRGEHKAL